MVWFFYTQNVAKFGDPINRRIESFADIVRFEELIFPVFLVELKLKIRYLFTFAIEFHIYPRSKD